MRPAFFKIVLVTLILLMLTPLVSADYVGAVKADEEAVKDSFRPPGYSPYAGQNYPTKVLWGD
ncbi:MAG: hypothetical protein ACYSO7_02970, partial [Planctomycetota bacterium]